MSIEEDIEITQNLSEWLVSPGGRAIPGTMVGQILDPKSPEGQAARRIYDLGLCFSCGKRKAQRTIRGHGYDRRECDICFHTTALKYAWKQIRAIPTIIYRLASSYGRDILKS